MNKGQTPPKQQRLKNGNSFASIFGEPIESRPWIHNAVKLENLLDTAKLWSRDHPGGLFRSVFDGQRRFRATCVRHPTREALLGYMCEASKH